MVKEKQRKRKKEKELATMQEPLRFAGVFAPSPPRPGAAAEEEARSVNNGVTVATSQVTLVLHSRIDH